MTDPARGAGVILDLTVHTADAIRFLTGREIVSVRAHAAPAGIELAVAGTMRLDDGVPVAFADAYSPQQARSSIEVHGDEGTLEAHGVLDGPIECGEDPYARTVARFIAGRPAATAEDGRASLAVALLARRGRLEAPEP